MKAGREYKSGTQWCVWRWTVTDSEYIIRLHLVKTPWFAICIHWVNKPDPEPFLHDHPVSFLSLILKGGYKELRGSGQSALGFYERRWWNYVAASCEDAHRIVEVESGTITLVFMGAKTREWGFHRPDGWIHWKEYYTAQRSRGGVVGMKKEEEEGTAREERVEAVRKRLQDARDARLVAREANGEVISSLERASSWVGPGWADLIARLEDDLAAGEREGRVVMTKEKKS